MNVPEDRPVLILCDFAEVVNGKLYVQGAGFNRVLAGQPAMLALAVLWNVPWEKANHRHTVRFQLLTEDGQPYKDPADQDIAVEGEFEIGRPPGARLGAPLPAPLGIRLPPIVFEPGGYTWEFLINGSVEATAVFDAIGA